MKKYFTLVCFLCLMLLLGGCKEKDKEFVPGDNELIHLTSTPKGGVETYQIYTMNIMIYVDGTVKIYASDFVKWLGNEDIPELTFTITPDEVEEIKQLIIEQDIYNLREEVGNRDGISGTIKRMTVYAADGTNTTGGVSISNKQFVTVYDGIEAIVREELYLYTGEINSIQYEGYVLYTNRSVELLDRDGQTVLDHENINDVYTYSQELEAGVAYYTVIEFNQYGGETLGNLSFWATKDNPVVLKLHINGSFETNITITNELNENKLYIPQASEAEAEELAEKIRSGLR